MLDFGNIGITEMNVDVGNEENIPKNRSADAGRAKIAE